MGSAPWQGPLFVAVVAFFVAVVAGDLAMSKSRLAVFAKALMVVSFFGAASPALAGSVHSCKTSYQRVRNTQDIRKVSRCVLDLSEGRVGDVVEIKNPYNYIIATGTIIRKKGRYTVVVLKDIFKDVKSGYPVIVRNNDSNDHWTATMAPY